MHRDDPPVAPRTIADSFVSLLSRRPSALSENTQPILLLSRQERNYNSLAGHSDKRRHLQDALEEAIRLIQKHG